MGIINLIWSKFTAQEKKLFILTSFVISLATISDAGVFISKNSFWVPVEGGTYKEGIIGQPVNINPVLSSREEDLKISSFLFDPLAQLLKNISVSEDGTTYTLELKDNLRWSDGTEISSDDVIFTIKTIQDFKNHSPLYDTWKGIKIERVSTIQTKIYLPNPNFVFEDDILSLRIIPSHIFKAIPIENVFLSDYRLKPISSGPYKFAKISKRKDGFITSYQLISNSFYQEKKPFIKKVEFVFLENVEEAKEALKLHKVNGISLFGLSIKEYETKGYNLVNIPTNTYYALFFNQTANNYLKNISFRNALIASINKEEIKKTFWQTDSPINQLPLLTTQEEKVKYDLLFAQNTISQIKTKTKSPIVLTITVPPIETLKNIAEYVKMSWLQAGIDEVNIITEDFSDPYTTPLKTKNYEILLFGNSLKNTDDLFPFWHSSQTNFPGLNLSFYQNTKVDATLEKIRKTKDKEQRKELQKEAIKNIINDSPAAFLITIPYTFIYSSNLTTVLPEKVSHYYDIYGFFKDWTISKVRVISTQR